MKHLTIFIFLMAASFSCADGKITGTVSIDDLSSYFTGFNGCFILYDESNNEYTIYNENKIQIRVSPCSTYKIIHSLIGLETGVLKDENTVFKWDGTQYPIESWNKDQTLTSAVSNSVV